MNMESDRTSECSNSARLLSDAEKKVLDSEEYTPTVTEEEDIDAHLRENGIVKITEVRVGTTSGEVNIERREFRNGQSILFAGGHGSSLLPSIEGERPKLFWGVEIDEDTREVKGAKAIWSPLFRNEPQQTALQDEDIANVAFALTRANPSEAQ